MNDRVIWKYYLAESKTIFLPPDAQILQVREQNSLVCMWVLLDPLATEVHQREFVLVCTGQTVGFQGIYLGTVHLAQGALVLHAFEIPV